MLRATAVRLLLLASVALWLNGCGALNNWRGILAVPEEVAKGDTRLLSNDTQGAMAQFDLAIKHRPHDSTLYRVIVDVCSRRGRADLVAHYAEQGAISLPAAAVEDRILLYSIAGEVYLRTGSPAKDVALNEEAYKLAPESPVVMNNLGYSLAETLDPDMPGASEKLRWALRLTSAAVERARDSGQSAPADIGTFLDSVGWVQYKLRLYNDAIANLTRAVYLCSDRSEIHYHLGMAYEKRQRYAEAAIEFKRAVKIEPGNLPAANALENLPPLPREPREASAPPAPNTPPRR